MSQPLLELSDAALPRADIKAIFFDIDGTLLGLDGTYTEATKTQIHRVKSAGVHVGIASGRPYFAAEFIARELGIDDVGVCCAGAHIVHPAIARDVHLAVMSQALSTSLCEALRESGMHYEIYTPDAYFFERDNLPEIRHTHAQHMRIAPSKANFDEVISVTPVIKFLAAVDRREDWHKLHALERAFPSLIFSYAAIASKPDWSFVSITTAEATRDRAFDVLLQHHNISAEQVMCFGDAQSDCVFLRRAGYGIAMGNAPEEVQQCARFVTKPVWEDGVAYAIERLIA